MIQIKPNIEQRSNCPYCGTELSPKNVFWQGIHIVLDSKCEGCGSEIIDDLRVGHGVNNYLQVNLIKEEVFAAVAYRKEWLGKPLLNSLQNPQPDKLEIVKEVFKPCKGAIILNCIDHLYGHSLLKLLNAQKHLECNSDCGLVVIVPKFLRWMVPDGVAEVWTVPISLKNGQNYYPSFAEFVQEETKRFDEIYVSEAHSHPSQFDITQFTRVPKHNFEEPETRITFIWREDRLLVNRLLFRVLRKLNQREMALPMQNLKIQQLFEKIRLQVPEAKFAVAGLGTKTKFPEWIEDYRVDSFNEKIEKEICRLYSESRLVIGLHGSNMLLPSGHAGMTIDLIDERWGNFAQDVLYQERDPRMASFRYRFLPYQTKTDTLAFIAAVMVLNWSKFKSQMTADVVNSDVVE
ncbi:hypothetical protein [Microcoleus asticus]|uniref:Uncharacterized protein n=1 Tax=Microcoleus asticus IPMA8 TaxID=2563858 RepID=A0ABX2D3P8_9CYAN|nr:hypothetical protein [Microcoleus asticus]NQE37118.1 hypothetical protein [Microcoleus asticus IPMA8]